MKSSSLAFALSISLLFGCETYGPPSGEGLGTCDVGYTEQPIAVGEPSPLGFAPRQALDTVTRSWVVDIKMGAWPATKLNIGVAHDGGPVVYRTKQGCPSVVATKVVVTLKSDDGKIDLAQPAMFEATKPDEVVVHQVLLLKGDGKLAGQAALPLAGKFEYPEFASDAGAHVADMRLMLPALKGTLGVFGVWERGNAISAGPMSVFGSW